MQLGDVLEYSRLTTHVVKDLPIKTYVIGSKEGGRDASRSDKANTVRRRRHVDMPAQPIEDRRQLRFERQQKNYCKAVNELNMKIRPDREERRQNPEFAAVAAPSHSINDQKFNGEKKYCDEPGTRCHQRLHRRQCRANESHFSKNRQARPTNQSMHCGRDRQSHGNDKIRDGSQTELSMEPVHQ